MKKKQLGFNLILLGQIASGKDIQAESLFKTYDLKKIESGKYWRKLAKEKSKEGELLRKTTILGKPAPVILMKKFLIEAIDKRPKNKNLLFIGNPRLKPEAQLLKKLFTQNKENFFVIYITLPDKEIFNRSLKRNRNGDDNKKFILKRIKWHKDQVSKTVEYFDSLGKLKKINGNQPVGKVSQDIQKAILFFQKKVN